MFKQILDRLGRSRRSHAKGESDALADMGDPTSREVGGEPKPDTQDVNSSSGTTPNESFVGRAGGDESGDVGPSGAEARGDGDLDHQGAARRE